ncbi:MAG: TonB-dependent receptor, partial [Flavisolibacter sp.]|nr:TonB-dependent receptor [Flavisolibacter sp.]
MTKHFLITTCFILFTLFTWAQAPITGRVTSESNEPLSGVSVMVKGGRQGAITNDSGYYSITITGLPTTLVFSSVGFEEKKVEVTTDGPLEVQLNESSALGNVVVVSATRVPLRIMQAPVSIERVGLQAIRTAPATSYYDILANTKGVDFATSGLLFKTPTTRGFGGSGNPRFNQLMDGMDNQLPGLNFAVGSFIGLTELDVESMELLPGASSALYGPGGMNGTLLVNSKNPFQYQGFSVLGRQGVMHVDKRQRPDASIFTDWSLRYAKAFNRFAFKLSAQYVHAQDWQATDSSNYLRLGSAGRVIPGNRQTDPNYDGVNVYGDETNTGGAGLIGLANAIQSAFPAALIGAFNNVPPGAPFTAYQQVINQLDPSVRPFAQQLAPFHYGLRNNLFPNQEISRTGYPETSVLEPTTKNLKFSGALHYKLPGNTEASLSGHWGTGTTIYTGSDRYVFKNVEIGQYKLEFRNPVWFTRVYTTQENAGDSYAATIAMRRLNEVWKPSYDPANPAGSWYPQYTAAFIQARISGASPAAAHNIARSFADQGRPAAGSDQFKQIFDNVNSIAISKGGSLFIDKSDLWVAEGQYNLSRYIDFAEVIVGADVKRYVLNSSGTIFIDSTGPISINEVGGYVQATKRLFDEKLILTASGRFDKNENFNSKLTPRLAAVVKVAENNNIRLSYQTAYRFPTTQGQYIRLEVGQNQYILGGLPWIVEYMNLKQNPAVLIENGTITNKPYQYKTFKPESSRTFELG